MMMGFTYYIFHGLYFFILFRYVLGYEYRSRKYISCACVLILITVALHSQILRLPLVHLFGDYYSMGSDLCFHIISITVLFLLFRSLRLGHLYLTEMVYIILGSILSMSGVLSSHHALTRSYVILTCVPVLSALILRVSGKRGDELRQSFRSVKLYKVWIFALLLRVSNSFVAVGADISSPRVYLDAQEHNAAIQTMMSLILLLCICSVILLDHRKAVLAEELQRSENYRKEQARQYLFLNEKQQELRAFRHDFRAHLSAVSTLLQSGAADEALQYVCKLNLQGERVCTVLTGNLIADAIINEYCDKGTADHVRIVVLGKFPREMRVSDMDLCTILNNALRNAYEAACKCRGKRKVLLEISSFEDSIYITISNSIEVLPEIRDQELIPAKRKDHQHGFGISNMKQALANCGGSVRWEIQTDDAGEKVVVTKIDLV